MGVDAGAYVTDVAENSPESPRAATSVPSPATTSSTSTSGSSTQHADTLCCHGRYEPEAGHNLPATIFDRTKYHSYGIVLQEAGIRSPVRLLSFPSTDGLI